MKKIIAIVMFIFGAILMLVWDEFTAGQVWLVGGLIVGGMS